MLVLTLYVFLFQDIFAPEPISAKLFLDSGRQVELADVKVKGPNPFHFQFNAEGYANLINLFRVARMTRLKDGRFELLFTDGTRAQGRVGGFSFVGNPIDKPHDTAFYSIRHIKRIHMVAGSQLRSCQKGHYEDYTPYPYCPACGDLLDIGPEGDDLPDRIILTPSHALRLDSREN